MNNNDTSTTMRLELPTELNDLLLRYKRAVKRNTGKTVNKDALILAILENHVPTLREKLRKLDAEYCQKMTVKP